jgi:hypothetical protein
MKPREWWRSWSRREMEVKEDNTGNEHWICGIREEVYDKKEAAVKNIRRQIEVNARDKNR